MDNGKEVRDFLVSRRGRITPADAGFVNDGSMRRVPGLRRSEVAVLAGVSIEYYTRLERGNLSGVSDSVLEAIARALQLDAAERAHLFDLARTANTAASRIPRRQAAPKIRPSVLRVLHSMTTTAAFVRNGRLDVLAMNQLGRALYAPVFDDPARPANLARFNFLDPRSTDFYPDWDNAADTSVALLHTEAGRDPYDRDLTALVGELSTRSAEFRRRWSDHNVRYHGEGTKLFHHRDVGDLALAYESVDMISEPGLTLTLYAAEPGSPTAHALDLLASWTSTGKATGTSPAALAQET